MKLTNTTIFLLVGGIVGLLGVVALAGYFFGYDHGWERAAPGQTDIKNFDDCAAAGNAVMESYPRQCRTKDGRLFVEQVAVPPSKPPGGSCAIGGCSSQICGEASEISDLVTTCEYRAEYACYKNARCERQASGRCGWTQTQDLIACLRNPPPLR